MWEQTSIRLRSYLRGMCRNGADADDLLQESYLRALRNWGQFNGRGSRGGWLFAIAQKTYIDWRRKQKRRRERSLEQMTQEKPAVQPTDETEQKEAVGGLIKQLKEEYRDVIYMRFAGGLSYAEMAEALGIPVGTVRSRLHRALKEMRQRWKGSEDEA